MIILNNQSFDLKIKQIILIIIDHSLLVHVFKSVKHMFADWIPEMVRKSTHNPALIPRPATGFQLVIGAFSMNTTTDGFGSYTHFTKHPFDISIYIYKYIYIYLLFIYTCKFYIYIYYCLSIYASI